MTATTTPTTESVLKEMLTENTGRHMLDSGGAYGRAWERNQGRDFESEPRATIRFEKYGFIMNLSTYHFLKDCLEYDAGLDQSFQDFANTPEQENESWFSNIEAFLDHLRETEEEGEITGLYGDSDPFTVNTYNHESLLDQTIQFTYFTKDDTPYVLLQIHGGCDVRGGYTRPRAFIVNDYDGTGILRDQDGCISCEGFHEDPNQGKIFNVPQENHHWNTDDGYHFYRDGACGAGAETQLEKYTWKEIESPEEWEKGFLCVDEDGNGYCPLCGAKLVASF